MIEPTDIPAVCDPWADWLQMLGFPRRYDPLDAEIEHRIERICYAADRHRLAVVPTTKRFASMWLQFRLHHEALEDCYKYRYRRWLVWRASALKVIYAGDHQDEADVYLAYDKLTETLDALGPGHRDNLDWFWQLHCDGDGIPSPLHEYGCMVLTLVRAVIPGRQWHYQPAMQRVAA